VFRPVALASLGLLACLRATAGPVDFKLVDTKGRPVADAIVSLVPLDAPTRAATAPDLAAPHGPVEIEQVRQEFLPYVTPVLAGTTVSFPNRDTEQHHVYSLSDAKKFEFPLYNPGRAEKIVFDRPGVVAIGCNVHDWMIAYVVVLDTPWFARSGADGTARVAGVPPGRYRAEVWQPRLENPETREINVADDTPATLTFTLPLKRDLRIRRPVEPGRGGYK
jgi:plastocyanin